MTEDLAIRPLAVADAPMLVKATLDNVNWSTRRFDEDDVWRRPEFRHYTQLVPERGDFGLVAERLPERVAVVWALFLPAQDAGYGFLDESTLEISLWVRDDSRGRGVGRMLLGRIQQQAVDRGVRRLSLSVEAGNFARELYESTGFVSVSGREDDGVMVWVA